MGSGQGWCWPRSSVASALDERTKSCDCRWRQIVRRRADAFRLSGQTVRSTMCASKIRVWVVAIAVALAAVAACDHPQTSNDYYDRGVAKFKDGKYEGAIADFEQAINIRPKYTDAYIKRADAKVGLGNIRRPSRTSVRPSNCSPTTHTPSSIEAMPRSSLVNIGKPSLTCKPLWNWRGRLATTTS